jgi:aryl-alcohol dehydrogenase-like predicted oxidoreductase
LGCNLIDTAATYTNGCSERLVGAVLAQVDARTDAFVMTKAGYPDKPDGQHSITPDFLAARLDRSLQRLGCSYVDGFLLHNPEHLIAQGLDSAEVAGAIAQAFAFLEECVSVGKIRFYGVSSNVIAAPLDPVLSLEAYLAQARHAATSHHFRLIQFPCNLLERDAVCNTEGASLVNRARAAGVVTVANRPLNALVGGRLVRLVRYEAHTEGLHDDASLLSACIAGVAKQLDRCGARMSPLDVPVLEYIANNWTDIETTDAVDELFVGILQKFLDAIYGGDIPDPDRTLLAQLHRRALAHAQARMNERAETARQQLKDSGSLDAADQRPLHVAACASLLDSGIDHVLVGMRSTDYVHSLRELLVGNRTHRRGTHGGLCTS